MNKDNKSNFRATSTLLFMPTVTEDIVDREWRWLAHTHKDQLFERLLPTFFAAGVHPKHWPLVYDKPYFPDMRENPSFLAGRRHFQCTVVHCGFSAYVPIPFQEHGCGAVLPAGWCGHAHTTKLERMFRLVHVKVDAIPWAKALSVLAVEHLTVKTVKRICVIRSSWTASLPWLAFHAEGKIFKCSQEEVQAFLLLTGQHCTCWCLEWCGDPKSYRL